MSTFIVDESRYYIHEEVGQDRPEGPYNRNLLPGALPTKVVSKANFQMAKSFGWDAP